MAAAALAGLLAVIVLAVWLAWPRPVAAPLPEQDEIARFLARHWPQNLAPQGLAPVDSITELASSLKPSDCGVCHADQLADWSQALHSHTMGPGIQWQLRLMTQEEGNRCLFCHAPLAEQKALVALARGWPAAPAEPPPAYVPSDLADAGLVCANCHLRGRELFGPGSMVPEGNGVKLHGNSTASAAFEDSRFCARCHQFPQDGPRTNGKLHEDTYEQWRAGASATRGETCQSCHMPGRRHQWQGIHSPEMVRKALTTDLRVTAGDDGRLLARLRVTNSGAGHHFPTYMVPKAVVSLTLVDERGVARKRLAEYVIGWNIETGLTGEIADTRLAEGESVVVSGGFDAPRRTGWKVEARIDVIPGEHYERIYTASLQQRDRLDAGTVTLLEEALRSTRAGRFEALRLQAPASAVEPGAVPKP
ncbi:hypothetical protein [Candidatus Dactylopiibacterium carminicum]|uniref:hypothetical protein n=1 Tax=Candidatus Dactylopiibacterium carminicum TaxID=857335 RepID=UPI001CC314CD|nr:hypothetical protein [Candidatus Dactylopiibacterium carminicum]